MGKGVFIYGSGGHARVIADILAAQGKTLLGFIDDDPSKRRRGGPGPEVIGLEGFPGPGTGEDVRVIIGIGDNGARRRATAKMEAAGRPGFDTAVHPSAVIGGNTSLGPGTVVMAGSVINCGSAIGRQVIINTAACVDHDCRIEEFVHISPGACLGGGVTIGAGSWIGLGASIINNCRIGRNVVVGMGTVVIEDIPDSWVVAGNPARFLRMNEED
jgi:acetyltransferase EpsM